MEIRKKIPLHRIERTDRHIKYIIGAGTILLCGYVIQSSVSMTLFEKVSALLGIFLGTTLAFFALKLLFPAQKTMN
jgi:fucose permease